MSNDTKPTSNCSESEFSDEPLPTTPVRTQPKRPVKRNTPRVLPPATPKKKGAQVPAAETTLPASWMSSVEAALNQLGSKLDLLDSYKNHTYSL